LPPGSADSLVAIDVSTGLEGPETEVCVARVAGRLNRLTLQRALYRSLGTALLAASALAACAAWLSPGAFRWALAGIAAATLLVVAWSVRAARAGWAGEIEAARWVERRVPLDQRLLTLVAARHAREARLWPELLADNRAQLPRWADARLGIAPVPASVLLLLAGVVAAWLFLVPWYDDAPEAAPAPAAARTAAQEDGPGGAGGTGGAAGARPDPRSAVQGDASRVETGAGAAEAQGAAPGGVAELQKDLASSFERSLGGSAVLRDGSKPSDRDAPTAGERGDVAESGLGRSGAEEGGKTPDEELARREKDDGSGQAVGRAGGPEEGGGSRTRTGPGERGRDADPSSQTQAQGGAQGGARAVPGGDAPADGPLAVGDEEGTKKHSGGAGAGSAKATEALLAKKPLTLSGGRHSARFALTLGGTAGSAASGGPKSMVGKPASRIADVERGAQDADGAVRHEEIPAEYESVVKRIFERNP